MAHVVELPLVRPFRTSLGTDNTKRALLIEIETADGIVGWGECVADPAPTYAAEFIDSAMLVIRDHLLPRLSSSPGGVNAADLPLLLAPVRGHEMAKGAVELAFLDAECQQLEMPLARYLDGSKAWVDCGVSVGIPVDEDIDSLLAQVDGYLREGFQRVKLKIEPGWDVGPVAAVRAEYPQLQLQVDANQAYRRSDIDVLARLDDFSLTLIEQPLDAADVLGHVSLVRQLETPICLDESITSVIGAESFLEAGACSVINIKAGRVGGYVTAAQIHDMCAASQVPVWCGGMLETGVGRSANIALASLTGFTLPGDIGPSRRFFAQDITEPFSMTADGRMEVPSAPGAVRHPLPEMLTRYLVGSQQVYP